MGPLWYTIYHHLPVVFQGVLQTPLVINQPMGKGHLWIWCSDANIQIMQQRPDAASPQVFFPAQVVDLSRQIEGYQTWNCWRILRKHDRIDVNHLLWLVDSVHIHLDIIGPTCGKHISHFWWESSLKSYYSATSAAWSKSFEIDPPTKWHPAQLWNRDRENASVIVCCRGLHDKQVCCNQINYSYI